MASSMLPTEQLWKLDQSNDCYLMFQRSMMASSMMPTEQLRKSDQPNDCLVNVSEEYDGFKYAAYRTAMEIRPIKWLFIECFIGV